MRHQPDLPYQFVHKTITFNDTIILEKENSSYKRDIGQLGSCFAVARHRLYHNVIVLRKITRLF